MRVELTAAMQAMHESQTNLPSNVRSWVHSAVMVIEQTTTNNQLVDYVLIYDFGIGAGEPFDIGAIYDEMKD